MMVKLIMATVTGLVAFTLIAAYALGLIGDPKAKRAKLEAGLEDQAREFLALGYFPWDDTGRIDGVNLAGSKLKFTVIQDPPTSGAATSSICNYRKLRDLVHDGAAIETTYRSPSDPAVRKIFVVETCPGR